MRILKELVGLVQIICGVTIVLIVSVWDLLKYGLVNMLSKQLYLVGPKGVLLIWVGVALIIWGIFRIVKYFDLK